MVDASRVHLVLSEHKAFSQLVQVVQLAEPHQKWVHHPSKSAHYRFVHRVHIWMEPKTCASNARKVSINRNHSKRLASRVHRITVPKLLPQLVAANVQIPVKQLPKARHTVTSMHTAFWCQKRPTSSVNVSQASMEREWTAKMCVITSVIIPVFASKIWRERHRVAVPAHLPDRNVPNGRNSHTLLVA